MDAAVIREHTGQAPVPPAVPARDEPAVGSWSYRPLAFGVAGALALLAFYLGVITAAQGWTHAVEQLAADRWFVGAIMAGFGTQIGLFTYLRALHRQHAQHMAGAAGSVAASTGTSTAAMLACCAHHLTEVFAVLGLSGTAVFLNAYKTPFLWLGIAMNLAGAGYLLWQIRDARRMSCHTAHTAHTAQEAVQTGAPAAGQAGHSTSAPAHVTAGE